MRYIPVVIMLWLSVLQAVGQTRKQTAFMYDVFNRNDTLIYTSRVPLHQIHLMEDVLNEDTLWAIGLGYYDSTKVLRLSKGERQYIRQELTNMRTLEWTETLFKNGRLIKTDSIGNVLDKNPATLPRPGRSRVVRQYSFSQPIFIRNHTLCIFSYGYHCGPKCGEGGVAVFRKSKNGWLSWMQLIKWAS